MAFWSFNVTSSYMVPFCFWGVSSRTWTCTWGGSKHSFWQTCSILICDPLVRDQRMVTHSCSRSILGVLPLVIKQVVAPWRLVIGSVLWSSFLFLWEFSLISPPLWSLMATPFDKFTTLLPLMKEGHKKLLNYTWKVTHMTRRALYPEG